jgi:hypothetical protein
MNPKAGERRLIESAEKNRARPSTPTLSGLPAMQLEQANIETPALTPRPVCQVVWLIDGTPPPKKL